MNSVIFWLQLTFLTNLLAKVFTVSVTIDMDTYGTPMWIMTNTSDRRPKESDGGNFNEVQPFINWNGVLKMVAPQGLTGGLSDEQEAIRPPEVYNWDTLPAFKNGLSCDSRFYEFDEDSDWNEWLRMTMITISVVLLAVICVFIARSFLTCSHHRGCHFCEDDDDDDATATFSALSCDNSANSANSGFAVNSV